MRCEIKKCWLLLVDEQRQQKFTVLFEYFFMKALVITPKNDIEFKFLTDLLNRLGIGSSELSKDELEDIGMSKLMQGIDKTKKASRSEIMKKLSA